MTQLHWKIIPTWLQLKKRSRIEKYRRISLNREVCNQGPMNQRLDCIDVEHKCRRFYDEYTARTGEGNRPIHPAQQIRQRRERQFYTVDPRTGWRFYPSSRPTTSSSSSHWEQHDDRKSSKSWDSWQTSS